MTRYGYTERQDIASKFRTFTIVGVVITCMLMIEVFGYFSLGILGTSISFVPYLFMMILFYEPFAFFVFLIGIPLCIFFMSKLTTSSLSPRNTKTNFWQHLTASIVICTVTVVSIFVPILMMT